MNPNLSISAKVLLFCALVHLVNGESQICSEMKKPKKAMFEEVFHREFMGCKLSPRQCMVAMGRINWMIPEGEQRMIDIARNSGRAFNRLNDMANEGEAKMATMGLKFARIALGRRGLLKVDRKCLTGLAPDLVASILVNSRNPKEFNRMLKKECKKAGLNIEMSAREETIITEIVTTITCIVGFVMSLFVDDETTEAIEEIKEIIETIIEILPCPSDSARIVNNMI